MRRRSFNHKKVDRENESKLFPIFNEHIRAQQQLGKELQFDIEKRSHSAGYCCVEVLQNTE